MQQYFLDLNPTYQMQCQHYYLGLSRIVQRWLHKHDIGEDRYQVESICNDIISSFIETLFEQHESELHSLSGGAIAEEELMSLSMESFATYATGYVVDNNYIDISGLNAEEVAHLGGIADNDGNGAVYDDSKILDAYMYFCADQDMDSPKTLISEEQEMDEVANVLG